MNFSRDSQPESAPSQRRVKGQKNWLPEQSSTLPTGSSIAIIGAGISGATAAAELASVGFLVTVFEAENAPAMAASGNIAGNCLPVVDRGNTPYNQWYWQAWRLAYHWWEAQEDRDQLGDLSGAFKWSTNMHKQTTWRKWVNELDRAELAQWGCPLVDAPDTEGVWFKQGGYLLPSQVVKRLLSHPNIHVRTNASVNALEQKGCAWRLSVDEGSNEDFDAVVVATGAQTARLLPEWTDFLQLNKGQVTHFSAADWSTAPSMVLSYGGYATPAVNGVTCVGATFEGNAPLGLTHEGHYHNVTMLGNVFPDALLPHAQPIGGHSAYRAMTSDHLPLVGQSVAVNAYQLRMRACALHPDTCPDGTDLLLPNLWLTLGQGSRGLTSSFLSAAVLRAQITGQATPVTEKLKLAVHPARVIFRQLTQNALK